MRKLATALFVAAAFGAGVTHAQTAAPAPGATTGPAARTTGTQGTGAAATAAAKAPATVKSIQPGLVEVAGPRVSEATAVGIQKISAKGATGGRAIHVSSPWGDSYFGWPKGVKPVAFDITVEKSGTAAMINAPGFTEANKADYRAAIDAVVPVAIAKTGDAKALKESHTRR
jgi:hypothetical protein